MVEHDQERLVKAWRVVAASVQGTSHVRAGLPCQDAWASLDLADGGIVLAVADGAGSAAQAEVASALAVEAAVLSVQQQMAATVPHSEDGWCWLLANAFAEARAALFLEAASHHSAPRDWATTLVLAVVSKQWTVGGLVGDCAVVVRREDGTFISLCPPQKGEYANMTNFLTQNDALDQLAVVALPYPVHQIALLSDGLLNLAVNLAHNRPFAPFFEPLFAFTNAAADDASASAQLADFLATERVNARTDDDKTLILASYAPPQRPG